MKLKLIRDKDTGLATTGRLYCCDEFLCFTLENTWKDNERQISCIPKGTYNLELKEYGRFYDKYKHPIIKLVNVPNRSEILFHIGNYPEDTLGCILLGKTIGNNGNAIWNSKDAYNEFYPIIKLANEITIE